VTGGEGFGLCRGGGWESNFSIKSVPQSQGQREKASRKKKGKKKVIKRERKIRPGCVRNYENSEGGGGH